MSLPTAIRRAVLVALVLLASAAATVRAQQSTPFGLRVFVDVDFEGMSAGFARDTPDFGPAGVARTTSSLQVGSGEVWEVCTEPRYTGRCRTVNGDVDDLRRGGWNDVISSARRLRGPGARNFGGGFSRPTATGLHLFEDINFRGSSATLTSNAPDLSEQGMARSVSSLELDPDEIWEVCTEANFRGRCQIVREGQSDLRRGNWNDAILSARRIRGAPPVFGGGRGMGGGLEVFADINFRGRNAALFGSTTDVATRGMPRTISSLRVPPGEVWEVCTETDYRGRCDLVFADVSDLRKGMWNDLIVSARRVR